jgi:hypothetical protein
MGHLYTAVKSRALYLTELRELFDTFPRNVRNSDTLRFEGGSPDPQDPIQSPLAPTGVGRVAWRCAGLLAAHVPWASL